MTEEFHKTQNVAFRNTDQAAALRQAQEEQEAKSNDPYHLHESRPAGGDRNLASQPTDYDAANMNRALGNPPAYQKGEERSRGMGWRLDDTVQKGESNEPVPWQPQQSESKRE